MNFQRSSKRPLTPLLFSASYIADFATKVRMFIWRNFCVFYDPISHEMHVAQMFNMVVGWKHTLKISFCIIFMVKKPCLKVQILQYKFLDWKWPPTAPLRNFSENSSVLEMWGVPFLAPPSQNYIYPSFAGCVWVIGSDTVLWRAQYSVDSFSGGIRTVT